MGFTFESVTIDQIHRTPSVFPSTPGCPNLMLVDTDCGFLKAHHRECFLTAAFTMGSAFPRSMQFSRLMRNGIHWSLAIEYCFRSCKDAWYCV